MEHRGLLKKNHRSIAVVQKLLDVAVILLALIASKTFYGQEWNEARVLLAGFGAVSFYLFLADINGLYRSWRVHSLWDEFKALALTLTGVILGLLLLAYATKTSSSFSRLAIGTWWLSLPFLLLLLRTVVRKTLKAMRNRGYNIRKVAILGNGGTAQRLAKEIQKNEWMGLHVAGFFDNREAFRDTITSASSAARIGNFDDLIQAARNNEFDEIYVALPMKADALIAQVLVELRDSSAPVHIVPDLLTFKLLNSRTSNIGNIPIVSIHESPMDEVEVILKRILDVSLSLIILTIIALPMLLIAIAIKLDSKGPAIFKQRRYGLKGETIWVWKFRSMTVLEDGSAVKQVTKTDNRIRPLGAFLRRSSLDELPQFINVLQGTMSIVGPRPHAIVHNELYRKSIDGYMLRHLVKPGITGWAQINGWRGETDTEEKMQKRVEFDMEYLRNWSILLDLKIIVLTIFKGFFNKNAY